MLQSHGYDGMDPVMGMLHVTNPAFLTAQNEAFQKMFCSFQMSNVQDDVIVLVDS